MKLLSKIDWVARLSELIVIVLGILIAFALNSWWDARTDKIRESDYIKQLRSDFEENQKNLEAAIEAEKGLKKNLESIVELIKTPPCDKNAELLSELLPQVLSFTRFTPVTGTYGSLIHSGDIGLIENADLRRSLVSFASTWDLIWIELQRLGDWIYSAISSPVAQEFIIAEMMVLDPKTRHKLPLEVKEKINYLSLLSDKRFNKFVADLYTGCSNRLVAYNALMKEVKEVIKQLNKEH
jgi:hypothetical protein